MKNKTELEWQEGFLQGEKDYNAGKPAHQNNPYRSSDKWYGWRAGYWTTHLKFSNEIKKGLNFEQTAS